MPPSPAGPIGCRYRNLAGTKWQSERREHRNPFCTQSLSAEIGVVFYMEPFGRVSAARFHLLEQIMSLFNE